MRVIEPNGQGIRGFFESYPESTPVVMLNLLKYRERATYPDDSGWEKCSGRTAYERYMAVARNKVAEAGGEFIWQGNVAASPIAPSDESWDEVILVRYPSAEAFLSMVTDTNYQALLIHRSAALEDSRLIAVQEK